MIVRDRGDSWQVVMQTDHADLAAAFARAWQPTVSDSLVVATERHDDGWAVWEQAPRVGEDGQPVNFLEVDVRSHLAFYRAGIAAITEQDPHAGLLVSMHGAGIYRRRYGLDPALGLARAGELQDEVEAFVAEQEAKFGGEPGEHQQEYELLQIFDRLSLYFCMRDAEHGEPEPVEVQGYTLEAAGPWRVRITPFPFGESPVSLSLKRRVIGKSATDATDLLGTEPELVAITVE